MTGVQTCALPILGWLGDGLPDNHPFREVRASPEVSTRPEIWMLGSSDYGAQVAAFFGLPFCFAYFITDGQGCAEAMNLYREGYRDVRGQPAHAAIGIYALAADTMEEAERHFSSRALSRLLRDRGHFPPLPTPEEAAAYPYSDAERAKIARIRERAIIGTGEMVRDRLAKLAAELGVQEIAILTPCHDPIARARSVTLLAQAFGLSASLALAAE